MAWRYAPEVRGIAREIMWQWHAHLLDQPMAYVFNDSSMRIQGNYAIGRAHLVRGMHAFLFQAGDDTDLDWWDPYFFVVEMQWDAWQRLSPEQCVALTDHELSHCIIETDMQGEPKPVLAPHDSEEFFTVVQRHGTWTIDLQVMREILGH